MRPRLPRALVGWVATVGSLLILAAILRDRGGTQRLLVPTLDPHLTEGLDQDTRLNATALAEALC
jgi:hypothetical protein